MSDTMPPEGLLTEEEFRRACATLDEIIRPDETVRANKKPTRAEVRWAKSILDDYEKRLPGLTFRQYQEVCQIVAAGETHLDDALMIVGYWERAR